MWTVLLSQVGSYHPIPDEKIHWKSWNTTIAAPSVHRTPFTYICISLINRSWFLLPTTKLQSCWSLEKKVTSNSEVKRSLSKSPVSHWGCLKVISNQVKSCKFSPRNDPFSSVDLSTSIFSFRKTPTTPFAVSTAWRSQEAVSVLPKHGAEAMHFAQPKDWEIWRFEKVGENSATVFWWWDDQKKWFYIKMPVTSKHKMVKVATSIRLRSNCRWATTSNHMSCSVALWLEHHILSDS